MTYLHIHIPLLFTEPFLHASREQTGTWLMLYAYCAEQENSGRIKNARQWAPATWARVIGTDTPGDCPLWHWNGDDFILHGYDCGNQDLAQRQRKAAKTGAKARWAKRE